MKSLKYFFGMLLVASVVVLTSCKDDDDKKKPDFTADYPEADAVNGKITIFAKFDAGVCPNGVVALPGSYKLKDGSKTDWSEEPAEMLKFVSAGTIGDKDWGAEGWYKVTVDLAPVKNGDGEVTPAGNVLGAKPVHLESGEFDWMFQIGDKNSVEVKSGDVDVVDGYTGECDIFFMTNATAAIIFKAWKNDPCSVVRHNYTFNVTVPDGTPADAEVYIAGGMNGWDASATKLTKNGNTYSITLDNIKEGTEYKYVMNALWANEELAEAGSEGCAEPTANRVTGSSTTINDEVKNWRRITIDRCGDGTYPDVDAEEGKITIFAKFETELCGEVVLVGTHVGWSDDPEILPKFVPAGVIDGKDWGADGWWEITIELTPDCEFDYDGGGVLSAKPVQLTEDGNFSWDFQVGYNEEDDVQKLAGGVDVLSTGGGECNILFRTNVTAVFIFNKWKNEPCGAITIPGGNGTFIVTITSEVEEGADIVFTGNFAEKGWGASDRVMTFDEDTETYSWTGEYPDNFECKVIKRIEGEDDAWSDGANQKFDGENFEFEFSF